jgi:glycosyltransferase involved in cell wall biosynthesis
MKILFISHTPIGGTFVVGSHHLARTMAGMGHAVLHLSPPLTPASLLYAHQRRISVRRWWNTGDVVDGVIAAVPSAPLPWAIIRRCTTDPHHMFADTCRASFQRILRKHQFLRPDVIFIDEPRLAPLIEDIPAPCKVYRPTDIYAELRRDPSILRAERFLIRRAHAFIATSQPVAEHLRKLGAAHVLLLENGVDVEHFVAGSRSRATPPALPPRPRAVYVGALDRRFGFAAVERAAEGNPGVSFVLAGPAAEATRNTMKRLANVHFLGPVPYRDVPALLHSSDLGILPFSSDPANDGRSPMKIYEYGAAGLPVVATRTPELSRRALRFVVLADGPRDFSEKLRSVIAGDLNPGSGIAVARAQSWTEKSLRALEYATRGQGQRRH